MGSGRNQGLCPPIRGIGVSDGIRTHDDRDHNPGLYQLSYAHHSVKHPTGGQLPTPVKAAIIPDNSGTETWRARQDSNLQPSA